MDIVEYAEKMLNAIQSGRTTLHTLGVLVKGLAIIHCQKYEYFESDMRSFINQMFTAVIERVNLRKQEKTAPHKDRKKKSVKAPSAATFRNGLLDNQDDFDISGAISSPALALEQFAIRSGRQLLPNTDNNQPFTQDSSSNLFQSSVSASEQQQRSRDVLLRDLSSFIHEMFEDEFNFNEEEEFGYDGIELSRLNIPSQDAQDTTDAGMSPHAPSPAYGEETPFTPFNNILIGGDLLGNEHTSGEMEQSDDKDEIDFKEVEDNILDNIAAELDVELNSDTESHQQEFDGLSRRVGGILQFESPLRPTAANRSRVVDDELSLDSPSIASRLNFTPDPSRFSANGGRQGMHLSRRVSTVSSLDSTLFRVHIEPSGQQLRREPVVRSNDAERNKTRILEGYGAVLPADGLRNANPKYVSLDTETTLPSHLRGRQIRQELQRPCELFEMTWVRGMFRSGLNGGPLIGYTIGRNPEFAEAPLAPACFSSPVNWFVETCKAMSHPAHVPFTDLNASPTRSSDATAAASSNSPQTSADRKADVHQEFDASEFIAAPPLTFESETEGIEDDEDLTFEVQQSPFFEVPTVETPRFSTASPIAVDDFILAPELLTAPGISSVFDALSFEEAAALAEAMTVAVAPAASGRAIDKDREHADATVRFLDALSKADLFKIDPHSQSHPMASKRTKQLSKNLLKSKASKITDNESNYRFVSLSHLDDEVTEREDDLSDSIMHSQDIPVSFSSLDDEDDLFMSPEISLSAGHVDALECLLRANLPQKSPFALPSLPSLDHLRILLTQPTLSQNKIIETAPQAHASPTTPAASPLDIPLLLSTPLSSQSPSSAVSIVSEDVSALPSPLHRVIFQPSAAAPSKKQQATPAAANLLARFNESPPRPSILPPPSLSPNSHLHQNQDTDSSILSNETDENANTTLFTERLWVHLFRRAIGRTAALAIFASTILLANPPGDENNNTHAHEDTTSPVSSAAAAVFGDGFASPALAGLAERVRPFIPPTFSSIPHRISMLDLLGGHYENENATVLHAARIFLSLMELRTRSLIEIYQEQNFNHDDERTYQKIGEIFVELHPSVIEALGKEL